MIEMLMLLARKIVRRIPAALLVSVAGTCASWAVVVWCGATVNNEAIARAEQPPAIQPPTFVLHLCGIGGKRSIDHMLVDGLAQGGLQAEFQIYDWTGEEQGLVALADPIRHDTEATRVAQMIEARFRANPQERIILTTHSGGAGIGAWALERLPADVKIDTWLMLAPALSPGYDLSKALSHVKGRAFAFNSVNDAIVLGAGTRLMGTIDRVKSDAAGRVGFQRPNKGDITQYAKLTNVPYDSDWMRFANMGDHIGPMMRPFVRRVLAPTLLNGVIPHTAVATLPTTAPAN